MPPKEIHKIKMMYAVYADGTKEPIIIDEIKNLSLEEAEPILEEHNFVKVVRCKDCRHYSADGWGYGNCYRSSVEYLRMADNGFCSYGERREEDDIH